MARIDLARRAQIGRDRRARTRAELIRAARTLYAARTFDSVTVDDVVNAAELAKGTFYVHFDDLDDLQSVLGDELAHEFDELLQPRRLSLDDPIERIAAGCGAFINQALQDPIWGALIVRAASAIPDFARAARGRLSEDIRRAAASWPPSRCCARNSLRVRYRHHRSGHAIGCGGPAEAETRAAHRRGHSARYRRASRGGPRNRLPPCQGRSAKILST